MDLNTLSIGGAILWAIVWVLMPDRILAKRPLAKRIFFGLGTLLGISAFIILLTQHT